MRDVVTDFILRQTSLIRDIINGYKNGQITLSSLVNNIESIISIIDDINLHKLVFRPLLDIEKLNSIVLDRGAPITASELLCILENISKIEDIVDGYERGRGLDLLG
jgi:hypothetical protein